MSDFIHQKSFLTLDEQREIVAITAGITPGFYTPKTRWGKPMSLQMNCLGHHWSARDYKYHPVRKDVDGLPCPAIPQSLQAMAMRAVAVTGYLPPGEVQPFDICIVNRYAETGSKLGDHVDNSESTASIASGYPVVSLSIGASCIFRIGGLQRTDPYEQHTLESGDVVIFGRSKRLAFHGVKTILPGTTPAALNLDPPGRLNFTFRLL